MAAREGTPLLEWISAAIGALITLALLGFIAFEAVSGPGNAPAAVGVRATAVHPTPGGYVVEITARNTSDQTAAAVRIEGALMRGAAEVEKSEAVLTYVPGQSERRAALIFSQDPRKHRLELRPTGYEEP